eukprot:1161157-Pelagomonas_calceolata.AAC.3
MAKRVLAVICWNEVEQDSVQLLYGCSNTADLAQKMYRHLNHPCLMDVKSTTEHSISLLVRSLIPASLPQQHPTRNSSCSFDANPACPRRHHLQQHLDLQGAQRHLRA